MRDKPYINGTTPIPTSSQKKSKLSLFYILYVSFLEDFCEVVSSVVPYRLYKTKSAVLSCLVFLIYALLSMSIYF